MPWLCDDAQNSLPLVSLGLQKQMTCCHVNICLCTLDKSVVKQSPFFGVCVCVSGVVKQNPFLGCVCVPGAVK